MSLRNCEKPAFMTLISRLSSLFDIVYLSARGFTGFDQLNAFMYLMSRVCDDNICFMKVWRDLVREAFLDHPVNKLGSASGQISIAYLDIKDWL